MSFKKICVVIISLSFFGGSFTFADDHALTFGETLTMYFSELFPISHPEVSDVVVKYSGISTRYALKLALQKGIYYKMIPNVATELNPDSPMDDRSFTLMLQRHFGIHIYADRSPLTASDYEAYMATLRDSFSYKLIQALNADTSSSPAANTTPTALSLSTANNYYILDGVYSLLQNNYLRSNTLDQTDLIYGATEGMVNELGDPYTKFFRPVASTDFHQSLDGDLIGIGVIVDVDSTGSLLIDDVISHSPAEKSGILPGDKITKIDDHIVKTDDGIADEIALLRGKEGTTVNVTVLSGKTTKTVTVTREIVHISLVDTDNTGSAFRLTF